MKMSSNSLPDHDGERVGMLPIRGRRDVRVAGRNPLRAIADVRNGIAPLLYTGAGRGIGFYATLIVVAVIFAPAILSPVNRAVGRAAFEIVERGAVGTQTETVAGESLECGVIGFPLIHLDKEVSRANSVF